MGMFDEIFKAIQNNPGSFAQAGLGGFNAYQQNQANEEANRKNRRNVGRANAINAFGGNAIAQREAPELSGLGKFGQVAQGGLQAFQGARAAGQASDLRDLQATQAQGNIDSNTFNRETAQGRLAANAQGANPFGVVRGENISQGGGIDPSLGQTGPLDFGDPREGPGDLQGNALQAFQAQENQIAQNQQEQGRLIEQRDLQNDRQDESLRLQKLQAESQVAIAKATAAGRTDARLFREAQNRDDFRSATTDHVGDIDAVKRLRKVEANAESLLLQIQDLKAGKVPFNGVNGLTIAKAFIRAYDDAQVTEGDIAVIRSQAQSAFQSAVETARRFVDTDNPNVFEPGIIDDMALALISLQEASTNSARGAVDAYYSGLATNKPELISMDIITNSRDGAYETFRLNRFAPVEGEETQLTPEGQDNSARFGGGDDAELTLQSAPRITQGGETVSGGARRQLQADAMGQGLIDAFSTDQRRPEQDEDNKRRRLLQTLGLGVQGGF